jgi:hypothetical protein
MVKDNKITMFTDKENSMLVKFVDFLMCFIIFFLILTPLSIVFKILGRDRLGRRQKKMDSYWSYRKKLITNITHKKK